MKTTINKQPSHDTTKKILSVSGRRQRILIIQSILLFCAGLVVYRLYNLQISGVEQWLAWAGKQHNSSIRVSSPRKDIVDRFMRPLATSVPVKKYLYKTKRNKR